MMPAEPLSSHSMPYHYHTIPLTDGTWRAVRVLACGPGGVISGRGAHLTLYLYDAKHGRAWQDPTHYPREDLEALLARIALASSP